MATPDKTLITRAEVTSIITPATGRVALVLDGKTIELGDTGWRDLSGSLNTLVSSGRILVRRQKGTITWRFIDVILAAGATTAQNLLSSVDPLVTPFLPGYHSYDSVKSSGTVEGRFTVLTAGSPRLDYATVSAGYAGLVSFPYRDAWPATALPGVADGEPIGV